MFVGERWVPMDIKMNESKTVALISEIIADIEADISDDEIIHLLLDKKVTTDKNVANHKSDTMGQIAADKLAKFVGSWLFVVTFCVIIIIWISLNIAMLAKPFDPYPFILLNLALSCVAAIQAPLIMMSQNRQEEKDRIRAENDYKVNLKTEIIIEDLHNKIDRLIEFTENAASKIN
jgi:uncharacterized membrane protein